VGTAAAAVNHCATKWARQQHPPSRGTTTAVSKTAAAAAAGTAVRASAAKLGRGSHHRAARRHTVANASEDGKNGKEDVAAKPEDAAASTRGERGLFALAGSIPDVIVAIVVAVAVWPVVLYVLGKACQMLLHRHANVL